MNLTGSPVIYDLDPYKQSSTQQHQYGAMAVDEFGDCYRYTGIGSSANDLTAGQLQVALANEDNHVNQSVGAAAAVGAESVEFTVGATAVDANEYDGGMFCFVDTSPEGESYRIKSHDSSDGSEDVTFVLDTGLATAATTDSEASVIRNPWNNPSAGQRITEVAAGVPLVDWDVSVANFGWLKTRGIAAVLGDTAGTTDGAQVTVSNQDNGGMGGRTSVTEPAWGQAMDAGVDGEYHPVFLLID